MEKNAYAKINLYLAVTGKRPDGYHDIESVMQTVSLCDTVTLDIEPSEKAAVTLTCSDSSLPTDSRNLAVRAAGLFLSRHPADVTVRIHIEKRIPVAAGLAGGSTDCAAVLHMMNDSFGKPFSLDELCGLGAALGADVPFCIRGGTAVTRGIGEIMEPCASMRELPILVVRPHEKMSTAEAYSRIDMLTDTVTPPLADMTKALAEGDVDAMARAMYNVFESVLCDGSEVHAIRSALLNTGAKAVMMSGSGPSVFAIYDSVGQAENGKETSSRLGYDSVIAYPVGG